MVVFIVVVVSFFSSDNVVMIGMNVAANHEQETGWIMSDGVEEGSIEAHFLLLLLVEVSFFVMMMVVVVASLLLFSFLQSVIVNKRRIAIDKLN